MTKNFVFRHFLIVILVVSEINGKKSTTEYSVDEKRVFDLYFDDKQTYSIDNCIPLAFGDFNADKNVDIFCRNTKGDIIRVMLNNHKTPTTQEQCKVQIDGIIFDAIAADFDGDSKLDLFVLYKKKVDQTGYNGGILWGNRVKLDDLQPTNYLFENIPTALDTNGDSYVELLGMISVDHITYKPACLYLQSRRVDYLEYLPNIDPLRPNSTQATADLNNDLVADLFLTHEINNKIKFRIYELPITKLKLIEEYDPPLGVAVYHLSTFMDIDADGQLEHVLPVCMDNTCSDSRIYVRDNNKWFQIPIIFGDGIRFPRPNELPFPLNTIPISIKVSDYNLDGFPDIVTVMEQSSTRNTMAIILQNHACPQDETTSCTYNRTFIPQTEETLVSAVTNANLAVFFDILENGYPDLLVLQGSNNQTFKLIGFRNSLVQDVNFIKVMVISSFSCESCSRQMRLPYGDNQPGQSIKMETVTTMNGITDYPIQLAAVQMAQSGQLSLELPYVIMGLGAIPNFVDKLTIGIPPNNQSSHLIRTFTQMIPNSQIVIVPSPLMNPDKWQSKLFITPSGMILLTGIALGVTLVVLAVVLGLLQYREKVEDDQERKLQAQSFHYDAL